MTPIIDLLEQRLQILFQGVTANSEAAKPNPDDRYTIFWERVTRYDIDDASRKTTAALSIVDQGQKFTWRTSLTEVTWRVAIQFCVRCNSTEDIRTKVNTARAEVFRFMCQDVMHDTGDLAYLDDLIPVADESFVERGDNYGEGLCLFDLKYRTKADDIRQRP